jgi:hypothetical protein
MLLVLLSAFEGSFGREIAEKDFIYEYLAKGLVRAPSLSVCLCLSLALCCAR